MTRQECLKIDKANSDIITVAHQLPGPCIICLRYSQKRALQRLNLDDYQADDEMVSLYVSKSGAFVLRGRSKRQRTVREKLHMKTIGQQSAPIAEL
jgi:hypothetical protein